MPFGKITTLIPNTLIPLTKQMFDTNIQTMYENDKNRHRDTSRLATFDSIHDFKTFASSNPVDMVQFNKNAGNHYINKCLFNFNRIMCRGAGLDKLLNFILLFSAVYLQFINLHNEACNTSPNLFLVKCVAIFVCFGALLKVSILVLL